MTGCCCTSAYSVFVSFPVLRRQDALLMPSDAEDDASDIQREGIANEQGQKKRRSRGHDLGYVDMLLEDGALQPQGGAAGGPGPFQRRRVKHVRALQQAHAAVAALVLHPHHVRAHPAPQELHHAGKHSLGAESSKLRYGL